MVAVHKRMVRRVLRWGGYELRKSKAKRGFCASYLSQLCQPATVFDVGVGYGTHELYKAFPDAKFVLVEPLREYEPVLKELATQYDIQVCYQAVSDAPGTCEIAVDTQDPHKSSLHERTSLTETNNPISRRTVDVTTLDTILEQNPQLERPIVLKVDTEGNELKVLAGAKRLLEVTDLVIAEVSVAKRFEGSYSFEELIAFMSEADFAVFDFLTVRPIKGRPGAQITDVAFKRVETSF
jgi:FkbM family methyltransferase